MRYNLHRCRPSKPVWIAAGDYCRSCFRSPRIDELEIEFPAHRDCDCSSCLPWTY